MGRGGGLTIDLVLVGIFFLSMFCLSVGFFSDGSLVWRSLLSFCIGYRFDAEGGLGF